LIDRCFDPLVDHHRVQEQEWMRALSECAEIGTLAACLGLGGRTAHAQQYLIDAEGPDNLDQRDD
jgi:hypothetical protein